MSRGYQTCSNCGEPASAAGVSIPRNSDGEIVPPSFVGDWGAVSACRACSDLYAAAGESAPAVLATYFKVHEATLSKLEDCRAALARLYVSARDACSDCEVSE